MKSRPNVELERQRMERALAALAGSGMDSTRFAVLLDPSGDLGALDRTMTGVLAVASGGAASILDSLNPGVDAAWVADVWADPTLDPSTADDVMCGWEVGSVVELRSDPPLDLDELAGWLIVGAEPPAEATDDQLLSALQAALGSGASRSRAAKVIAAEFGVPKRRVYDLALGTDKG